MAPSGINLFLTILFIPISFFIKHCIEVIFGCVGFWLVNFGGLLALKYRISDILDGSKIPLDILGRFLPFVLWTPFAFLLHYPVQIYLGKYDWKQTLLIFLGGIIWCVVLWTLARIVFKLGLKRYEGTGM
jgi:ABC-2 type transport system permease protein